MDRDGNVFFTDQPNDRTVKWSAADGKFSDWLKPAGRANGTYFDRDGNLIACADEKNELWSIAPDKKVNRAADEFRRQIEQIPVPEGWTANVTFGGKERDLHFITASKNVYGLKMRVKGTI